MTNNFSQKEYNRGYGAGWRDYRTCKEIDPEFARQYWATLDNMENILQGTNESYKAGYIDGVNYSILDEIFAD